MFKHIHVHTYFGRVQLNNKSNKKVRKCNQLQHLTCTLQIDDMINFEKVSLGETNVNFFAIISKIIYGFNNS